MAKHLISIDEDLYQDISSYCEINNLKIAKFCNEMLRKLFANEKYGDVPFGKMKDDDFPIIKKVHNEPKQENPVSLDKREELEVSKEQQTEIKEEVKDLYKATTVRRPKVRKL